MINLADHLPPNPNTVNREEVRTNYSSPWYWEYTWFLKNVGRIRSGSLDLEATFPLLIKGSSKDKLVELATEMHKDMQRRHNSTRNQGHKPKMFPLSPQATEYASPETILIYLESNPDV